MSTLLEDLTRFLQRSPTSFHAVKELACRFASQEFSPLSETEKWALAPGGKYFVQREGSLAAFCLPKKLEKACIIAAHTDSPALKIKPKPDLSKESMALLGVEVYGSPLLSSWMNRDLAIAGKIEVENGQGMREERLIFLEESPLVIAQLPIHLDREGNEKGLQINKQEHLCPIMGLGENLSLEGLLKKHSSFKSLLSHELFLVPTQEPSYVGVNGELLASYRLDNLSSCHAGASALAQTKSPSKDTLQIAFFWDHEEVGSRSAMGAFSPFLLEILRRISLAYSMGEEDFFRMKRRSLCISVDVAHGYNPNFPGKFDPEHLPHLGRGVVIKHNADLKYATSSLSAAMIQQIANTHALRLQPYVSRSDIPSGSTVGPIIAGGSGISVVDIGAPILSMHSAREVMAWQDHEELTKLLTYVLQEGIDGK